MKLGEAEALTGGDGGEKVVEKSKTENDFRNCNMWSKKAHVPANDYANELTGTVGGAVGRKHCGVCVP